MEEELLYKDFAKYYDLIYNWKDYKSEVDILLNLISKYKKSDGNDLLEVACGTGGHIKYLKEHFDCIGIDINQTMLDVAKESFKDVQFEQGDMINFNLDKKFDVIVCLFSSIGYVKTDENLRKTINSFSRHLKENGVIIIEPWLTKELYKVNLIHLNSYDGQDLKIARMGYSGIDGNISLIEMQYLIAVANNPKIQHFIEKHELRMFEIEDFLKAFQEEKLKAEFIKDGLTGRGLYIATNN